MLFLIIVWHYYNTNKSCLSCPACYFRKLETRTQKQYRVKLQLYHDKSKYLYFSSTIHYQWYNHEGKVHMAL